MDTPTCQRCAATTDKLIRLYIGLAQDTNSVGPLPLQPLRLTGGMLDICGECYGQWLAAIKTWFELTTRALWTRNTSTAFSKTGGSLTLIMAGNSLPRTMNNKLLGDVDSPGFGDVNSPPFGDVN